MASCIRCFALSATEAMNSRMRSGAGRCIAGTRAPGRRGEEHVFAPSSLQNMRSCNRELPRPASIQGPIAVELLRFEAIPGQNASA